MLVVVVLVVVVVVVSVVERGVCKTAGDRAGEGLRNPSGRSPVFERRIVNTGCPASAGLAPSGLPTTMLFARTFRVEGCVLNERVTSWRGEAGDVTPCSSRSSLRRLVGDAGKGLSAYFSGALGEVGGDSKAPPESPGGGETGVLAKATDRGREETLGFPSWLPDENTRVRKVRGDFNGVVGLLGVDKLELLGWITGRHFSSTAMRRSMSLLCVGLAEPVRHSSISPGEISAARQGWAKGELLSD